MKKIDKYDFFYVLENNYDDHADKAIHKYHDFHEELAYILKPYYKAPNILDLGAGTGYTCSVLLESFPKARITAIDLFQVMLDKAKIRLKKYNHQITYVVNDFRLYEFKEKYNICVSALAFHHMLPNEKKMMFDKIFHCLSEDGSFVLLDWTKFQHKKNEDISYKVAINHAKRQLENKEFIEKWSYHWKYLNIPDTVEDSITWLKEAGFNKTECLCRYYGLSLIIATK